MIFNDALLKYAYKANGIDAKVFKGKVLVLGLGNAHIIKQIQCDYLKIVEIDKNVISEFGNGYDVDHADAFDYVTEEKYDFIFIDIWYKQVEHTLVNSLIDKYKINLKEGGQIVYLPLIIK